MNAPLPTEQHLAEYREAMRNCDVKAPLMVYDSNSWRRVGLIHEYHTVMQPCIARDGHPDISGGDVLRAMVAAFNAMLIEEQRRG